MTLYVDWFNLVAICFAIGFILVGGYLLIVGIAALIRGHFGEW